jgi:thiomorpholine-carboxylate dehydrogenase
MAILLTEDDVKRVLTADDLVSAMEAAIKGFSSGGVEQPVRTILPVDRAGFFGLMPAYLRSPAAVGAKLVTVFHDNAARGLPTHLATIVLLDPETGGLLAIMDGRYITEARTAAVSAVSARLLATPDAADLAIIGSGVQARSHLEMLAHIRGLTRVRVWSPTARHREAFAAEMHHVCRNLVAVGSAEEAVRGASLIVIAAAATDTPVFDDAWVAPGAHIMAIGAYRPDQREMDPATVKRARLFVDSRAAALVEAGDIVQAIREGRFGADHIAGELGEVALGRIAARQSPDEITIFKSLGMAVEDVATAELVYRRAAEQGIGRGIAL